MRILVVEDDINVADIVRRILVGQQYVVDVVHDGKSGAERACDGEYDLVILDLMLPLMDGKAVCRHVRSEGVLTPILMLTALGLPTDVVSGLDQGADDYLTKPFDGSVLLARVRSLTRRSTDLRTTQVRIGEIVLDVARRTVHRDGLPLALTAKEFMLLEYLVMNSDRVLTRDAIGEHVWDLHFDPRSNVIESLVRFLRLKVDVAGDDSLIQTVRGVGYRLAVPA